MAKRALPLFLFILFSFLLYLYSYQGFNVLLSSTPAHVQTTAQVGYWLVFGGVMFLVLKGMLSGFRSREFTTSFKVAMHAYITLLVSQLVFVVVLLGDDVYRWGASWAIGTEIPRHSVVIEIGLVLALGPFISFIYGMLHGKYNYKVHKHVLYFDDLPLAFDGYTLTQISDIHAGSFDDAKAVQRGIDLINKQQTDMFVFTGDLVNNKAQEIEPWINHFKQIRARDGQFSILGNHDYGDYVAWDSPAVKENNLATLKQHHASIGFRLLLDENITLTHDNQSIHLLGVENWGVGFGKRGNLAKALSGTKAEDFKILLSHDPSHWKAEVKDNPSRIQLTLAGHTHGIQFGIERFGIKWSPVKYRYPHWAGLLQENERYLYVNRGFGFLGFSGRVGIWPEITVLELRRTK